MLVIISGNFLSNAIEMVQLCIDVQQSNLLYLLQPVTACSNVRNLYNRCTFLHAIACSNILACSNVNYYMNYGKSLRTLL